jgi:rhodanese-related sulfurtransferase
MADPARSPSRRRLARPIDAGEHAAMTATTRAAAALVHFERRLAFETDVADVAAALRAGDPPFTLLDVRSPASFARGHARAARNVPAASIDAGVAAALPPGPLVVYCWGPGCNGAHKAAARLARHGREVKEMIGGFEYWVREGMPVEGADAAALGARADRALVGGG